MLFGEIKKQDQRLVKVTIAKTGTTRTFRIDEQVLVKANIFYLNFTDTFSIYKSNYNKCSYFEQKK